jgi:hypothetical protein
MLHRIESPRFAERIACYCGVAEFKSDLAERLMGAPRRTA